eukprot:Skav204804  [mRNA]  locus=scaffold3682:98996:110315:- [translate_table: standard]
MALVSLVLQKADKLNRGKSKRTTSSKADGISEDSLEELGFALGLCASRTDVMRFVGANPRRDVEIIQDEEFDDEDETAAPSSDVATEHALKDCELSARLKHEITQITSAPLTASPALDHDPDAVATAPPVEVPACEGVRHGTLREILIEHRIPQRITEAKGALKGLRLMQTMMPSILQFCAHARLSEGFLSKRSIFQTPNISRSRENEHTLAAAKRAWGLNAARQSRSASWMQFSKRTVEKANAASSTGAIASMVSSFRPSFMMKDGVRDYQILAITQVVGKVELCLTESVWRGSLKKANSVAWQAAAEAPEQRGEKNSCHIAATDVLQLLTQFEVAPNQLPLRSLRRVLTWLGAEAPGCAQRLEEVLPIRQLPGPGDAQVAMTEAAAVIRDQSGYIFTSPEKDLGFHATGCVSLQR